MWNFNVIKIGQAPPASEHHDNGVVHTSGGGSGGCHDPKAVRSGCTPADRKASLHCRVRNLLFCLKWGLACGLLTIRYANIAATGQMSDDTLPMNTLRNGSVLEALSLTPSIPGSAGLSTEMLLRER